MTSVSLARDGTQHQVGRKNTAIMWRRIDLHNHTNPNEKCDAIWDPESWVQSAIDADLEVVAVTDHDRCERYEELAKTAGSRLAVLPGVEISTDRGHVLVISVGDEGATIVKEFCVRLGIRPERQINLDALLAMLQEEASSGRLFAAHVVTIAAHADLEGHLLGAKNSLSLPRQLEYAQQLTAIEVCRDNVLLEWQSGGVKQGPQLVLTRGSDTHDPDSRRPVDMWMFLAEFSIESLQHAFALPESSLEFEPPSEPAKYVIESIHFSDGLHAGETLSFCERSNAIIGPPNSGKSLVVDALKFVFGVQAQIPEVEHVTERRLKTCIPKGTTVTVEVRVDGKRESFARTYGGTESPSVPFKPIVFSQTELIRRSHERRPSIRLLDVHCLDVGRLEDDLATMAALIQTTFQSLTQLAEGIRRRGQNLSNTEDGLEATKRKLLDASGAAPAAERSTAISRVEGWRNTVRERLKAGADLRLQLPEFPSAPSDLPDDLAVYVPETELDEIVKSYDEASSNLLEQTHNRVLAALERSAEAFAETKSDAEEKLGGAGFAAGSEVTTQIQTLTSRVANLEAEELKQRSDEKTIEAGLVDLRKQVQDAQEQRSEITGVRREAASELNKSMHSFFAVVNQDDDTSELDALIDDLKTGTHMREGALKAMRDGLNRWSLLENAIRRVQGKTPDAHDTSEQSRLISNAIERNRISELAVLATTWTTDGLDLRTKPKPGQQPTPFDELTEGLRALAIKEVSFAASDLPVITDQPEDAVPTRSVYESLVPTIRNQRATRQFIVVSHDANIVVASDVEQVIAIHCADDGSCESGSLFDRKIRDLALEHLEGGQEAFQRRSSHYSRP